MSSYDFEDLPPEDPRRLLAVQLLKHLVKHVPEAEKNSTFESASELVLRPFAAPPLASSRNENFQTLWHRTAAVEPPVTHPNGLHFTNGCAQPTPAQQKVSLRFSDEAMHSRVDAEEIVLRNYRAVGEKLLRELCGDALMLDIGLDPPNPSCNRPRYCVDDGDVHEVDGYKSRFEVNVTFPHERLKAVREAAAAMLSELTQQAAVEPPTEVEPASAPVRTKARRVVAPK